MDTGDTTLRGIRFDGLSQLPSFPSLETVAKDFLLDKLVQMVDNFNGPSIWKSAEIVNWKSMFQNVPGGILERLYKKLFSINPTKKHLVMIFVSELEIFKIQQFNSLKFGNSTFSWLISLYKSHFDKNNMF